MPSQWSWEPQHGKSSRYESVRTSESDSDAVDVEKHLLSPDDQSSISEHEQKPTHTSRLSRRAVVAFTIVNALFLAWSTMMVIVNLRQGNELNHDLKETRAWSPVLDDIEVPIVNKKVEGHLFPRNDGTDLLGRLEPGKAADDAWEDYEIQRPFAISSEQVRKLGKDPEKTVKYPSDYGLGDDAYMAGLDVFHQLHCFDAIRKEAFKDYYWDGERFHEDMYSDPPKRVHSELWWIHMRHCVDIITQSLMCHADTEMTTMTWLETQDRPWPDFSINRKCRDFDQIVKWRDDNAQDIARSGLVKKPYDQTKMQDMYFELFGNDTSPGKNRHHPAWE